MKYIAAYDEFFDEIFQYEISDDDLEKLNYRCNESKEEIIEHENCKIIRHKINRPEASKEPFPNIPIMDRRRSVRHPEFYTVEDLE